MEDRPASSSEQPFPPASPKSRLAGRGAWVLTAYGICGLAVFGLLAYFFSDFIAH